MARVFMHPSHGAAHGSGPAFRPETIPTPRLIFWETTGDCNLRCVHCRREWSCAPSNELTTAEAQDLIDQIAETRWGSILVFSGGEPLMRRDLFALLAHAQSRHVPVALATNATRIDSEIARRLAEHAVPRVSVSLDGATASTHDAFRGQPGSFAQALNGIADLRSAGIAVQINVTFTKANLGQAEQILDLAQRIGACALHVFLLVPVGCGVELPEQVRLSASEVEQLLSYFDEQASVRDFEVRATCAPQAQRIRQQRARARQLRGLPAGRGLAPSSKGCLAGGGILFVDAVGKVFPCGYLPLEVGDLRKQSLRDILQSSTLLSSLRDTDKLQGRCAECSFAPSCGGCRARAYGTCGDLFADEPSCPMGLRKNPTE